MRASSSTRTSAIYQFPDPGELNRRITLRQREDIPSDDYGTDPEYRNVKKVWAKIRQVSATAYQESVQTEEKVTHYITIRYRAGITSASEVVYNDQLFSVRRIRDLNDARRFLLLECEAFGAENPQGDMYG